jgi:hypothetical protein
MCAALLRRRNSRFDPIAWETEVWVADAPSHLIHFNGERFLGPYGVKPVMVKYCTLAKERALIFHAFSLSAKVRACAETIIFGHAEVNVQNLNKTGHS